MSPVIVRIFFSILSVCYIAAIFILAGAPVADSWSDFNPYSLLHIPLYGIMTLLLVCSLVPIPQVLKHRPFRPGNDPTRPRTRGTAGLKPRLFAAAAIAGVVGIFDEVHQFYVPGRDASVGDVVLDMVGIALALLLCWILFKARPFNHSTP
jgi:hypothetical protein